MVKYTHGTQKQRGVSILQDTTLTNKRWKLVDKSLPKWMDLRSIHVSGPRRESVLQLWAICHAWCQTLTSSIMHVHASFLHSCFSPLFLHSCPGASILSCFTAHNLCLGFSERIQVERLFMFHLEEVCVFSFSDTLKYLTHPGHYGTCWGRCRELQ